jgi:hypothetical protein
MGKFVWGNRARTSPWHLQSSWNSLTRTWKWTANKAVMKIWQTSKSTANSCPTLKKQLRLRKRSSCVTFKFHGCYISQNCRTYAEIWRMYSFHLIMWEFFYRTCGLFTSKQIVSYFSPLLLSRGVPEATACRVIYVLQLSSLYIDFFANMHCRRLVRCFLHQVEWTCKAYVYFTAALSINSTVPFWYSECNTTRYAPFCKLENGDVFKSVVFIFSVLSNCSWNWNHSSGILYSNSMSLSMRPVLSFWMK